jgi:hypothetical protein
LVSAEDIAARRHLLTADTHRLDRAAHQCHPEREQAVDTRGTGAACYETGQGWRRKHGLEERGDVEEGEGG